MSVGAEIPNNPASSVIRNPPTWAAVSVQMLNGISHLSADSAADAAAVGSGDVGDAKDAVDAADVDTSATPLLGFLLQKSDRKPCGA